MFLNLSAGKKTYLVVAFAFLSVHPFHPSVAAKHIAFRSDFDGFVVGFPVASAENMDETHEILDELAT